MLCVNRRGNPKPLQDCITSVVCCLIIPALFVIALTFSIGDMIGGTIGGVIGLALVCYCIYRCCKDKQPTDGNQVR